MAENKLFSLQGPVYLSARDNAGRPVKPIWVGDATLEMAFDVTTVDHNESFSGQRLLYGRLTTQKNANLTLTLWEMLPDVLSLGLYSTLQTLTSGAVTAEALPADLAADDLVKLDKAFVSNVVITDADSAPLTEGEHYVVERADSGLVRILDLASFVQPFSVAYDYAATRVAPFFTATPPERWLTLDGVNTLNNERVLVDLYRVQFSPTSQFNLHNDEFGSFQLTGAAMADASKQADPNFGPFGRVTFKDE
ncbi:hypothetical protein FACS1894185_4780 [Betaproteobacteria bacterium]|nr:hypothetical protein FACS1894185_4780 [Betaproteobacteria bacterium]